MTLAWADWIVHWSGADGGAIYDIYSGIAALGVGLGLVSIGGMIWKQRVCHVHGCHWRNKRWLPPRLSWHPSPEHGGHPVCKHHHYEHPRGGAHTHVVTATGLHRLRDG